MQDTPIANRVQIALCGRRNAGKSSLINALTGQQAALVSEVPGTTTDPVIKTMELLPLGPVALIDTAGLDDSGEVGELRVAKTRQVLDRANIVLLVCTGELRDTAMERDWIEACGKRGIPVVGVLNKTDLIDANEARLSAKLGIPFVKVSALTGQNIDLLKQAICRYAPPHCANPGIVGDLIRPKAVVLLVAPQDIQAPKGRLILPQVQVIRDILDHRGQVLAVTAEQLPDALNALKREPDLVITDSQIFAKVNAVVPRHIPLTSFSILMARVKGELDMLAEGAKTIDTLKPGDKVLIAEACTHHPLQGDIAREKLPGWLEQNTGGKLDFTITVGPDYPDNLAQYKLVVHCGGCMLSRQQMMSRLAKTGGKSVPITNFGMAIARLNGILDRAMEIFTQHVPASPK